MRNGLALCFGRGRWREAKCEEIANARLRNLDFIQDSVGHHQSVSKERTGYIYGEGGGGCDQRHRKRKGKRTDEVTQERQNVSGGHGKSKKSSPW